MAEPGRALLLLEDGRTFEGMAAYAEGEVAADEDRPVPAVQLHREASPGPHDTHSIFDELFASLGAKAAGAR